MPSQRLERDTKSLEERTAGFRQHHHASFHLLDNTLAGLAGETDAAKFYAGAESSTTAD